MPWFWILQVILGIGVAGFLIKGALAPHTPGGHVFAVLVLVIFLANPLLAFISRRRTRAVVASRDREDRRNGRTLDPRLFPPQPVASLSGPVKWVGGANVPGRLGRFNASWPLAALELTCDALSLDIVAGRLFGMKSLTAVPSAVELVFPVRGRLVAIGIAICLPTVPDAYF